jgi:hypothetical protein
MMRIWDESMNKLCIFVGMMVVGYAGWWLGAKMSFFAAFALSSLGNLVGIYLGWRVNRDYLS